MVWPLLVSALLLWAPFPRELHSSGSIALCLSGGLVNGRHQYKTEGQEEERARVLLLSLFHGGAVDMAVFPL